MYPGLHCPSSGLCFQKMSWTPNEIAALCYNHYRAKLPKQGQPDTNREWTLLAAVVQVETAQGKDCTKKVVALGTGTKCIGQSRLSKTGDILQDSHAEIIAKRSFQRYLLHQLSLALTKTQDSVFVPGNESRKWTVRAGVCFVFFTSHTPCGDASIIPMSPPEDQLCPTSSVLEKTSLVTDSMNPGCKRKRMDCEHSSSTKKVKQDGGESRDESHDQEDSQTADSGSTPEALDVYRTGAKCVPGVAQDSHNPGVDYHTVGVLRVKPGRGDRTLSMSCSDKMARWNVLGCQGALLMHFLQQPIYLAALVVGKCPFNLESMERALHSRCAKVTALPEAFTVHTLDIRQSQLQFHHGKEALKDGDDTRKLVPCGSAISWSSVPQQPLDVTANGYRQGTTKKAIGTPQSRSRICKAELFHTFRDLVKGQSEEQLPESLRSRELNTYREYKEAAVSYQEAWKQLRQQAFTSWIQTPRDYLHFS
ncbi:PREDICTED: tRNA-specific adenosine deaminase 1 [Nanorana parkeri]|uniref:tRNA-specific adenosine deaminase 1 n=1 Tax=Nanorana parkeri TaxID=125878 RepID=UPI000854C7B2|nr:PREDICTED: tRNA-specific adenosine deaminase 1 [Nanorana parkeri]